MEKNHTNESNRLRGKIRLKNVNIKKYMNCLCNRLYFEILLIFLKGLHLILNFCIHNQLSFMKFEKSHEVQLP